MYSSKAICGFGLGVAALKEETAETQGLVVDGSCGGEDAATVAARLITTAVVVVAKRMLPVNRDVGCPFGWGGLVVRWWR